jgi:hypothetical protein
MWVFLSRRLRLWFVLAVGLPVLAKLGSLAADTLERRSGRTTVTKALRKGSGWAQRKAKADTTGIAAKVTHLIPGDDPVIPATPEKKGSWWRR